MISFYVVSNSVQIVAVRERLMAYFNAVSQHQRYTQTVIKRLSDLMTTVSGAIGQGCLLW